MEWSIRGADVIQRNCRAKNHHNEDEIKLRNLRGPYNDLETGTFQPSKEEGTINHRMLMNIERRGVTATNSRVNVVMRLKHYSAIYKKEKGLIIKKPREDAKLTHTLVDLSVRSQL